MSYLLDATQAALRSMVKAAVSLFLFSRPNIENLIFSPRVEDDGASCKLSVVVQIFVTSYHSNLNVFLPVCKRAFAAQLEILEKWIRVLKAGCTVLLACFRYETSKMQNQYNDFKIRDVHLKYVLASYTDR